MDDKEKDTLGGASLGAILGSAFGPGGTIVGGLVGGLFGSQEEKHMAVLRETFYKIEATTADHAKLHCAHIEPDGAEPGGTGGVVTDIEGKPDVICKQTPGTNLIVEVETSEAFEQQRRHTLEQLIDYEADGFALALVVLEDEISAAERFVNEHEEMLPNRLKIRTPETVTELV